MVQTFPIHSLCSGGTYQTWVTVPAGLVGAELVRRTLLAQASRITSSPTANAEIVTQNPFL